MQEQEEIPDAPNFEPLKRQDVELPRDHRRIMIPSNRLTPLKQQWLSIYTPLVSELGLQVKANYKRKCVEIRSCDETKGLGNVQKGEDFLKAFCRGFEIDDALALVRLDDLYIDTFLTKDIKTLNGPALSRAIGRILGKNGKTKNTIENTTRTRIVVCDTSISILGSFASIGKARDAVCDLVMGSSVGKVYGKLRGGARRGGI